MRVTIKKMSSPSNGKQLEIEPNWSFADLLKAITEKLQLDEPAKRIFIDVYEVHEMEVLSDRDKLIVTCGEDIITYSGVIAADTFDALERSVNNMHSIICSIGEEVKMIQDSMKEEDVQKAISRIPSTKRTQPPTSLETKKKNETKLCYHARI